MNSIFSKKMWTIINYLMVPCICTIASLYTFWTNQRSEYNLMFLLPLVFLFCYELLLKKNLTNSFKIFSTSYTLASAIRYVAGPVLIVLGGRYDGRSSLTPSEDSFVLAFLLMIIELLTCSVLIWILGRKLEKKDTGEAEGKTIKLPTHWVVYIIFIFVTISLVIMRPGLLSSFSFIRPNEQLLNYDNFDTFDQIIILCMNVSKNLIMLLMLSSLYKNYKKKSGVFWVFLSFLVILLNSSLYFGTNRFDFVLNLIASTIVFCKLFKDYYKITVLAMSILCCFGFVLISQARGLRGAIDNSNSFYQVADIVQMYFGGPYNVAMSIETAEAFPEGRNIGTALYDCTRSVIGMNVLVKKIDGVKLTNYYFNRRIFNNDHYSQIIPMIGEGYYLFGFALAPLFDIMFIFIAYILTKNKDKWSLEIGFFFILSIVRLGFINCQSATIQLNDLSFNIVVPLILFFLNNMIKPHKSTNGTKRIGNGEEIV